MGNKRLRIILLLFVMTVSISLTALFMVYKHRETLRDRSILNGNPCAVPCWQGIMPGITTRQQALNVLEQSSYIEKDSLKQTGNLTVGGANWQWKVSGKRMQPSLFWRDDIVEEITLGLTFDLTLDEVIERFGVPEAVVVNEGGQPEKWYWIIDLYYPSKGAQFKAYSTEFSDLIESSTEIGGVTLYSPMPLEERLQNQYNATILPHIMEILRPWKGYGHIFGTYYENKDELFLGR